MQRPGDLGAASPVAVLHSCGQVLKYKIRGCPMPWASAIFRDQGPAVRFKREVLVISGWGELKQLRDAG